MPPKKSAAAKIENGDADASQFRWTVDVERKLLLFMLCTTTVTLSKDVANKIAPAFPGTNWNGVQQRASKLRRDGKALLEEHGLTSLDGKPTPEGGAEKSSTPKGRKRKDTTSDTTPSKKLKGDDNETTGDSPSNDLGVKTEDTEI